MGAYLFLKFLDGGLFEGGGGLIRGGVYKIILDIRKTLLKDLVYFRKSFFCALERIYGSSGGLFEGGGLLTICCSRVGAYSRGGAFSKGAF